jgi:NitT/TauT family transport system substrate-binding protein
LFEKRGIEVKLKFVGNDDQIFASVMSGEADIGVGDPVFAAIAGEKGFPGRVIAEMVKKIGLTGVTKGDVSVKAPKDLAGKRICSFPAPSTTYTLLTEMIRKSDVRNTKIVQVAMGSQLAALSAKQCEIALDLEPSVTNAESKGFVAEFPFDRFNDVMTITGFQTTRRSLMKRVSC